MATISVQAGVGLHVIEQRPGQAREALAAIKKICDDGLTDNKTILGILRTDTPTPEEEPRTPSGGLDRLPDLLHTAEAAGLQVELTVAGEPRPLPAPVDLAAYRIIGEALTNVLRHAPAHTVRLALTHEAVRLLIRIRNDGPTTASPLPASRADRWARHRRDARACPRPVRPADRGPAPRRRLRGTRASCPSRNRHDVPR